MAGKARDKLILISGVAAFVAVRLAVLFFSSGIYQQDPEELLAGNFAVSVLTGAPILPLRMYMNTRMHGAGLLTSLLALPVFICFGTSHLSLKLVPLIWSTATFALLYAVVRIYAGRKAAIIACLLYLLPPANALYYSLWADAVHQFTPACMLAMLLFLHRYRTATRATDARMWAAILGFTMSFSFFLWPSNIIAALIVLGCLLLEPPRDDCRTRGPVAFFLLAGVLAGFLPLIPSAELSYLIWFFNLSGHPPPSGGRSVEIASRACWLSGPMLWTSYRPWGSPSALWERMAYLSGLASWLWFAWKTAAGRRICCGALGVVIIAYPVLFTLLFACCLGLSDMAGPGRPYFDAWHLRYAYPLAFVLALSSSLLICALLSARTRTLRAGGAALLASFLVFGAYSAYTVLVPAAPGLGLKQPGSFMQETGCRIAGRYMYDWPAFESLMAQIAAIPDPLVRNDLARGAAWVTCSAGILSSHPSALHVEKFSACDDIVAHHVPAALRGLFREEMGALIFCYWQFNLEATITAIARGLPPERAAQAFIGVARMLPAWTTDPRDLNDALGRIPMDDKDRLAWAMGRYFAAVPDGEKTAAAIAGGLSWKRSFLDGCRKPFGTRMHMLPNATN